MFRRNKNTIFQLHTLNGEKKKIARYLRQCLKIESVFSRFFLEIFLSSVHELTVDRSTIWKLKKNTHKHMQSSSNFEIVIDIQSSKFDYRENCMKR